MNAIKTLLAVSVVAATASANAAVYTITGAETGSTNTAATLVISPSNAPWIPQTVAAALAAQTTNAVTGSLDITGTTINSGSLNVAAGGLYTFLGDYFGTTMNTSAAVITFAGGTWSSTGSVVAGSCSGPGAGAICSSAYAGSPVLDYNLTDNGLVGGLQDYTLVLRLGTTDPKVTGGLTTQTYHLTAPAVPVPAAAWLFGSSLLGLAGAARRRRAA